MGDSLQQTLKTLVLELQKKTKVLQRSIQTATKEQAQSDDVSRIESLKKQIGS